MSPQIEKNIMVTRGIPIKGNNGSSNWGDPSFNTGSGSPAELHFLFLARVAEIKRQQAEAAARLRALQLAQEAEQFRVHQQAVEAARQLAQRQAEQAARQLAQRQAEEAAHQLAQRQAEEAARQLAQRQAEEAARQLAQRQAEEAALQLAQRQAEETALQLAQREAAEAARQLAQRQVEEAARQLAQREAEKEAAPQLPLDEAARHKAIALGNLPLLSSTAVPATALTAGALSNGISASAEEFARRALISVATRLVPAIAPVLTGMLIPSELGNGELPPVAALDSLGPTHLPIVPGEPSIYPGATVVEQPQTDTTAGGIDTSPENFGLPAESDLPSSGLLIKNPEHTYHPTPPSLGAFPEAIKVRPKSSVSGGDKRRARWRDKDGTLLEWDSQHGTVEKYNKRGRHLGEFDPKTGKQTKKADKARKIEV